ncbi:MAG: polysaccharide deacetylase family protein, partial [Oscillospiraceae bacterium]|nr:polysaccharide deacetylase family protein [Oscillospiraceae bacterium]
MKRLTSLIILFALVIGVFVLPSRVNADAGDKLVALTFDDGPGPYTARLLDGLKERGVVVTFFMLGSRAEAYPAIVKRAYEEGHQIANHSYSHAEMTALGDSAIQNEFSRTADLLYQKSGGAADCIVRLPYGSSSARVRSLISAPIIVWSVDPVDWKYRNAATVRQNITSDVFDGAIVLAHDIHSTTVDGALAAIDDLLARGYEFVTVNELFRRRGIPMENGVEYYSCKPGGSTDPGPIPMPEIFSSIRNGKIEITLLSTGDAPIYYTTDGSSPAVSGQIYTEPFLVPANTTIRAFAAYSFNGGRSREAVLELTLPQAAAPILQISDDYMILTSPDPYAEIHYNFTGKPADSEDPLYTSAVPLARDVIISVCCTADGYADSNQITGWYSPLGNFFLDIRPGSWYSDGIDYAAAKGILQGKAAGVFSAEDLLNRGQMAAVLYRWAGEPGWTAEAPFRDVLPTHYFAAAVNWAYENGLVAGKAPDRFDPDGTVTREELAAFVQ